MKKRPKRPIDIREQRKSRSRERPKYLEVMEMEKIVVGARR